jgi:hypothetical protein
VAWQSGLGEAPLVRFGLGEAVKARWRWDVLGMAWRGVAGSQGPARLGTTRQGLAWRGSLG